LGENKIVSDTQIGEAFLKIKQEIDELKEAFASLKNDLRAIKSQIITQKSTNLSAKFLGTQLGTQKAKTPKSSELTHRTPFSIGNRGASALRQQIGTQLGTQNSSKMLQENVERLKKALKDTFKQLTRQEFQIFSLLYQLEDELKRPVTYNDLASRSKLTPNSLRDYISKLIIKKVPIIKERLNNRQILLKIAPELRNIETLENLMKIVEG